MSMASLRLSIRSDREKIFYILSGSDHSLYYRNLGRCKRWQFRKFFFNCKILHHRMISKSLSMEVLFQIFDILYLQNSCRRQIYVFLFQLVLLGSLIDLFLISVTDKWQKMIIQVRRNYLFLLEDPFYEH